jgi:hypothetical protein
MISCIYELILQMIASKPRRYTRPRNPKDGPADWNVYTCSVGYAFINFVDPLDIVDFVRARANQRWNCYKSDKVAEISYATIQGKDCLVQKFRNSSVMLEPAHYRPKVSRHSPYMVTP